jgi:hypothetical protein
VNFKKSILLHLEVRLILFPRWEKEECCGVGNTKDELFQGSLLQIEERVGVVAIIRHRQYI